jgi:DNA repair protein SbcD/Mre11
VRLLHTADWHIGKVLRGADRRDEQARVLKQIAKIAVEEKVDAVLIAGDIYDSVSPTAESQRMVVQTLLALARRRIEVVLIAGNHDHGPTLEAYKPLMDAAGIYVYGVARPADSGGIHTFTARSTHEKVNVAVLPFLSQRYAVRAAEIIANTPAANVGEYEQLLRDVILNLTGGFTDDAVNIFMAHLTCTGALTGGGGERAAQTIFEYHVPASVFPADAHYVALGHLHRQQKVDAACPVYYSGSPFAVDFGEQDNTQVVLLVEATPTTPARVTEVPITEGRRLRTVEGTAQQLIAGTGTYGEDYLRLVVTQAAYAGMREELLEAIPNVLQIRIHPDFGATSGKSGVAVAGPARTPAEQFADYCATVGVDDPRVQSLFRELHDQITAGS